MVITGPLQTLARNYRVRDGEAIHSRLLGGSVRMSVATRRPWNFLLKDRTRLFFSYQQASQHDIARGSSKRLKRMVVRVAGAKGVAKEGTE